MPEPELDEVTAFLNTPPVTNPPPAPTHDDDTDLHRINNAEDQRDGLHLDEVA